MKRIIVLIILCVVVQAVAQSRRDYRDSRSSRDDSRRSSSSSTRPTSRQSYSDAYASLEEHNIFLRDRRSYRPDRGNSSTTRPTQRSPEESFVVTGIVLEDGAYHAYVEDPDSHVVTRLLPGQKIARGTVGNCDIDAVEYLHNGQSLWVQIGQDLTGKYSTAFASSYTSYSSPATTGPTTLPADLAGLNPNDPNLTTEQRMRLRRYQERR